VYYGHSRRRVKNCGESFSKMTNFSVEMQSHA
jgi:hypothetical protein